MVSRKLRSALKEFQPLKGLILTKYRLHLVMVSGDGVSTPYRSYSNPVKGAGNMVIPEEFQPLIGLILTH